jgi:hypothetical protein
VNLDTTFVQKTADNAFGKYLYYKKEKGRKDTERLTGRVTQACVVHLSPAVVTMGRQDGDELWGQERQKS